MNIAKINFRGKSRLAAFTLIELLVVIAIIAILASILFPVFARARENARRASCMSNMKQLALGFMQYTQDFDERFPLGSQPFAGYRVGTGWAGQMYTYVKSSQLFKCPSDSSKPTAATRVTVSYGYNDCVGEDDPLALVGGAQYTHMSHLIAPAKTVLLYEVSGSEANVTDPQEGNTGVYSCSGSGTSNIFCLGGSTTNNNGTAKYAMGYMGGRTFTTGPCTWGNVSDSGCYDTPNGRHLDGGNFVLADGHAKWFKGSQVSNGSPPATSTTDEAVAGSTSAGTATSTFQITFSNK